jgi:hypothetical protein
MPKIILHLSHSIKLSLFFVGFDLHLHELPDIIRKVLLGHHGLPDDLAGIVLVHDGLPGVDE